MGYNYHIEDHNGKVIGSAFTLKGILALIKAKGYSIKGNPLRNYDGGLTYQVEAK